MLSGGSHESDRDRKSGVHRGGGRQSRRVGAHGRSAGGFAEPDRTWVGKGILRQVPLGADRRVARELDPDGEHAERAIAPAPVTA